MSKVALVYHPRYEEYDFGAVHPLKPWRWRLAFELFKALHIVDGGAVRVVEASPASRGDLLLFHDSDYIDFVAERSTEGSGPPDSGDTQAFPGCFEAASLFVGGTLKAADLVMQGEVEVAFNLGGGFHHAHSNQASGFCIFNDVAVCLTHITSRYDVQRVAYLDIDAHHGDGVMYAFYESPAVLDIDFHESGAYLFPGTGRVDEIGSGEGSGFKVNIPLPPQTSDEAFMKAFDTLVPRLLRAYKPEVVLLQSGTDAHYADRLAHLALTTQSYMHVARSVKQLTEELCGGKLLVTAGGGYNTLNAARCWALELAEFADARVSNLIPQEWSDLYLGLEGSAFTRLMWSDEEAESQLRNPAVVREVEGIVGEVKRLVFPRLNIQG